MKDIINKISKLFSNKAHQMDNINLICRNASGELSAYCRKEYINK